MNNSLFSFIVCPTCKRVFSRKTNTTLTCRFCRKSYSIDHGIPVLIDIAKLPPHLAGQVKYFTAESSSYGNEYIPELWQKKFVEIFFNYFRSLKGKIVIDDACGSGYMSIEAAKRGARVIACDLNMSGLVRLNNFAKKLGLSKQIITICCSSEILPIRNGCAEGLVANAILEHLPDEEAAIKEISRVTKKGAAAMITVPIAYYLLNPIFLLMNYIHDKRIGHLRRYTIQILRQRFSGWKTKRTYYSGHTAKVVKTMINMVRPVFNEEQLERNDQKQSAKALFSSNICVLFNKS